MDKMNLKSKYITQNKWIVVDNMSWNINESKKGIYHIKEMNQKTKYIILFKWIIKKNISHIRNESQLQIYHAM